MKYAGTSLIAKHLPPWVGVRLLAMSAGAQAPITIGDFNYTLPNGKSIQPIGNHPTAPAPTKTPAVL